MTILPILQKVSAIEQMCYLNSKAKMVKTTTKTDLYQIITKVWSKMALVRWMSRKWSRLKKNYYKNLILLYQFSRSKRSRVWKVWMNLLCQVREIKLIVCGQKRDGWKASYLGLQAKTVFTAAGNYWAKVIKKLKERITRSRFFQNQLIIWARNWTNR